MIDYQNFKIIWVTFNKVVNFNYEADDNVISIAYEILGNCEINILSAALKKTVTKSKYQIAVSDVLKEINALSGISENDLEYTANQAWERLTSLLLSYGLNRSFLFENTVISAVVEAFGGLEAFYALDFNDFNKSKFVRYYLDLASVKNEYKLLSPIDKKSDLVQLVPANYSKSFTLKDDNAQKLLDNAELIHKKVLYLIQEDRKKIEYTAEKEVSNPASPERIEQVFKLLVDAFSKSKECTENAI